MSNEPWLCEKTVETALGVVTIYRGECAFPNSMSVSVLQGDYKVINNVDTYRTSDMNQVLSFLGFGLQPLQTKEITEAIGAIESTELVYEESP